MYVCPGPPIGATGNPLFAVVPEHGTDLDENTFLGWPVWDASSVLALRVLERPHLVEDRLKEVRTWPARASIVANADWSVCVRARKMDGHFDA